MRGILGVRLNSAARVAQQPKRSHCDGGIGTCGCSFRRFPSSLENALAFGQEIAESAGRRRVPDVSCDGPGRRRFPNLHLSSHRVRRFAATSRHGRSGIAADAERSLLAVVLGPAEQIGVLRQGAIAHSGQARAALANRRSESSGPNPNRSCRKSFRFGVSRLRFVDLRAFHAYSGKSREKMESLIAATY